MCSLVSVRKGFLYVYGIENYLDELLLIGIGKISINNVPRVSLSSSCSSKQPMTTELQPRSRVRRSVRSLTDMKICEFSLNQHTRNQGLWYGSSNISCTKTSKYNG